MPVARIDINRIDIAVVVSLLIHGLFAMLPPITPKPGERAAPAEFIATIVNMPAQKAAEPVVTPEPVPVPQLVRPKPIVSPKVAAAAPTVPAPLKTEPVEKAVTPPTPTFDMAALINQRRERREQMEESLVARERARGATQPGSSDPLAVINRNLAGMSSSTDDGTGGVFQILSKGTRTGEFAFNGWRPDTNRRWREVIEVDAGLGGDIERAMVKRMIELIRGHYTGDFIWRSHRLGKNITMSARPEDSAQLEEFLLREFFDTPTLAHTNNGQPRPPGRRVH